MKKITKATFKSFIKKNSDNLMISCKSSFDGMIDGMSYNQDKSFSKICKTTGHIEHTCGIQGVWLVGNSRDSFNTYETENMTGIEVYNCCGNFIIAVPK